MSLSHAKERFYWSQLRAALTAGKWTSPHPAKAPKGTLLSWKELIRKFRKHSKNIVVGEIALQTQALGELIETDEADSNQALLGQRALEMTWEITLKDEFSERGLLGYQSLKSLDSSNYSAVSLALAYYSYALGNYQECLAHIDQVPNISDIEKHIPNPEPPEPSSLPILGISGRPSISSVAASFASAHDSISPEIRDGRGWAMTEVLRSLCLKGMCHERLCPSDPTKALQAYAEAIPLFGIISSTTWSPKSSGKLDFTPFMQLRELWRWVGRLIWRAIVLCSKTHMHQHLKQAEAPLWTWFGLYVSCSSSWPASFFAEYRSSISSLYLRALVIRYRIPSKRHPVSEKSPTWLQPARSVIQDYRAILSVCTAFPPAGQNNVLVEEFIDLCVAIWETSGENGEYTDWVIDILWWATRLTFNSPRVFRHLTRLLYVSGDAALAKKTLRLYVQVVGKAWQTSKEGALEDIDTDTFWVETLAFGAMMMCKYAGKARGSQLLNDVREAGMFIEKARTRLDFNNKKLLARVELADGIYHTILALKEQEPFTRPKNLADAHAHLLKSIEAYPSPSAYFQIALSFSQPGPFRDMQKAIQYSGKAVEADSSGVRYWHLLGLLLTAVEKWKEAKVALEEGAALDATGTDTEVSEALGGGEDKKGEDMSIHQIFVSRGLAVQDIDHAHAQSNRDTLSFIFDHADCEVDVEDNFILDTNATSIPSASSLLHSVFDNYRPLKQELFEFSLQLRLTQAALVEVIEGAEGAESEWFEIFSWIADMKRIPAEVHKPSFDGKRSFVGINGNAAEVFRMQQEEKGTPAPAPSDLNLASDDSGHHVPSAVSITVTPATDNVRPSKNENQSFNVEKNVWKRSSSIDRDTSTSKKVQKMLKNRVHQGQARITAVSRKIGNNVVRNSPLRRANSTPDFHAVLHHTSYQASSIHSRKRLSSIIASQDCISTSSPPPPLPLVPAISHHHQQQQDGGSNLTRNNRSAQENRLLSNLWLMAAATFRRLGKIEQAKGAIQEAEVRDETNPTVWVQLGLYHVALRARQNAIDALQKALFIFPDDVSATVHLARLYMDSGGGTSVTSDEVDLAATMLEYLTRGLGWDVPEAWYYLGKAYGLQGRKEREKDTLMHALELSENRGVRDFSVALGWFD